MAKKKRTKNKKVKWTFKAPLVEEEINKISNWSFKAPLVKGER